MTKLRLNRWPRKMNPSAAPLTSNYEQDTVETGVEDYLFQKTALDYGQLDSTDAGQLCVARAHADSKCPPRFGCRQFPVVDRSAFPPAFFEAINVLSSKASEESQSVVKPFGAEKEITSCLLTQS